MGAALQAKAVRGLCPIQGNSYPEKALLAACKCSSLAAQQCHYIDESVVNNSRDWHSPKKAVSSHSFPGVHVPGCTAAPAPGECCIVCGLHHHLRSPCCLDVLLQHCLACCLNPAGRPSPSLQAIPEWMDVSHKIAQKYILRLSCTSKAWAR